MAIDETLHSRQSRFDARCSASQRLLSRATLSRRIINLAVSRTVKCPHIWRERMIRTSFFSSFRRTKKNHSAGEDTVGTHCTLRNMDKAIEPRSVSFQFPGAPSSMGSNPTRISFSLFLPTTFDDIPIYSQLLAGTLYDQIPSRKTLFPLYPISSPSVILFSSFSLFLSSRLFSRYLIPFPYIFIFFRFNISSFIASNIYSGPYKIFA